MYNTPISYKIKLVMGGTTNSGKISFLHDVYTEEEFSQIGVSFIPLECIMNNGNSYVFIIWNLDSKETFRFMYSKFTKGASGALLFFDTSDYNSFRDLENWIKIIRASAGNIPIILIGNISDLNHLKVAKEDIFDLIKNKGLECVYFTSSNDKDIGKKKKAVFKRFIQKINPESNDATISFPLEDEKFKEFLAHFSICPICKKDNHIYNLKDFFFSPDPNHVKIKNTLLDLIEDFDEINTDYSRNITFGIPCCNCYKKLGFNKK